VQRLIRVIFAGLAKNSDGVVPTVSLDNFLRASLSNEAVGCLSTFASFFDNERKSTFIERLLDDTPDVMQKQDEWALAQMEASLQMLESQSKPEDLDESATSLRRSLFGSKRSNTSLDRMDTSDDQGGPTEAKQEPTDSNDELDLPGILRRPDDDPGKPLAVSISCSSLSTVSSRCPGETCESSPSSNIPYDLS